MLKKLQSAIKDHGLFEKGQRVLLGVSGGADSVSLLHALNELSAELEITLFVVHLDHCVRGKESKEDAKFVRKLAHKLKMMCVIESVDVPKLAKKKGISIEMAAREARYALFGRVLRKLKADVVATAHTSDDQAETVILKLARGAGPEGVSGIAHATDIDMLRVVRPMLDVSRKEVLEFLNKRDLEWREDESNQDTLFLRNRVRHVVLPLIEAALNPKVKEAICRFADIAGEENRHMEDLAEQALGDIMDDSCALRASDLAGIDLALRRRAIRSWLSIAGVAPEGMDFDTVERIDALATAGRGSLTIAGDWQVTCRKNLLSIGQSSVAEEPAAFKTAIPVPGDILLPECDCRIVTTSSPGLVKDKTAGAGRLPCRASIAASAIGRKKLYVRSWRAGDRMNPFGMNGSKKVQDILVDEKVPTELKHRIPIFECAKEIIWIPGYRIARGWEITDKNAPAIQIAVEKV
jgi:tRNA(Ile)-lysidine synthase